jgi:hypothetical protein
MNFVRAVWQIPLAFGSWLFFHWMKFVLGRLYTFALSRMTSEAREWKVFSEGTISRPFVLPIIATKGPRWNTHAVIITAGPLEVTQTLSFKVATATASAASWSIVLYANPGYETVTSIESFRIPEAEQWHEVNLAPGKYSINVRYYGLHDRALAPEVKADGVEIIRAMEVPPDSNNFYQNLRRRDNGFYACLHYYVFHMLRLRKWLPDSFVRREFLPVGDPGTIFRYGLICFDECLDIESRQELLQDYNIYLTLYTRSSFPTDSTIIGEPSYRTAPASTDGFFLLRIRRKGSIAREYDENWMRVQAGTGRLVHRPLYDSASKPCR